MNDIPLAVDLSPFSSKTLFLHLLLLLLIQLLLRLLLHLPLHLLALLCHQMTKKKKLNML